MSERRMFAKTIIDSDVFLDMPQSSQLLYFHLSMRADDEGFINNPKSIMRNIRCTEEDILQLINKKFIIPFESGIVVIKHWKIHNFIRNDRFKPTKYQDEKLMLALDENDAYTTSKNQVDTIGIPSGNQVTTKWQPNDNQVTTKWQPNDNQVTTKWQPNDNQMDTQVRLGKVRLGKDRLVEGSGNENNNNKKERKNATYDEILSQIADDSLRETYLEYIKMRKMIKSPMTNRALTMLIKKVNELEPTDIDRQKQLLETAIMNNWKSVYPLKEDKPKKNSIHDAICKQNAVDSELVQKLTNNIDNLDI